MLFCANSKRGYKNILFSNEQLDLTNQSKVYRYLKNKPEFIFICAAKVGGILSNNNHKADSENNHTDKLNLQAFLLELKTIF